MTNVRVSLSDYAAAAAAMETIGVIEAVRTRLEQQQRQPVASPLLPALHHNTPPPPPLSSQSPVSAPKFGHQRNLSLDFRSMGIILPPLSATIQPHKYFHFLFTPIKRAITIMFGVAVRDIREIVAWTLCCKRFRNRSRTDPPLLLLATTVFTTIILRTTDRSTKPVTTDIHR